MARVAATAGSVGHVEEERGPRAAYWGYGASPWDQLRPGGGLASGRFGIKSPRNRFDNAPRTFADLCRTKV